MSPFILELNYQIVARIETDIATGNKSVFFFVVLILILVLSSGIFNLTRVSNILLFEKMQVKIGTSFMRKIYQKVSELPHAFYDDPDQAAKLKRITLFSQDSMLTQNMVHLISACCNIAALILVFPVLYKAGPGMFFLILIISIVNNLFNFDEGLLRWKQQTKLEKLVIRKEKIRRYFLDKDAVLEMRMMNSQSFFEKKWEDAENTVYHDQYRFNRKLERRKLIFSAVQLALKSIPLLIVTIQFSLNAADVAIVFLIWQTEQQFQHMMSAIFDELKAVHYSAEYIEELLSFLSAENENDEKNVQSDDAVISLNQVDFQYGNGPPVLHNISLNIKQGEKIAVIGPNGAGKTTLIKILSGLYKPTKGQAHISPHKERAGAVWQDYVKFELSLRESIGLGYKQYIDNDKKIMETLQKLDIEHLCSHLDCIVGKSFDPEGIIPSSGQWQKLAIGRAVFGDKEVVFMDEPTASLDPVSEVNLYQTIQNLFKRQTVIFVSHRIGFANLADRVIVMDGGRIVEDGTHRQLLDLKGFYASFYREQLKWYNNVEEINDEKNRHN